MPMKNSNKLNLIQCHLPIDRYGRPGRKRVNTKALIIHGTDAPKQHAKVTLRWWVIKNKKKFRLARPLKNYIFNSCHHIIELNGDLYEAMPWDEVALHVGAVKYKKGITKWLSKRPNNMTMGVELAFQDETGKPTIEQYITLRKWIQHFLRKLDLRTDCIKLHNHITGKNCHRYFVKYPSVWSEFIQAVNDDKKWSEFIELEKYVRST